MLLEDQYGIGDVVDLDELEIWVADGAARNVAPAGAASAGAASAVAAAALSSVRSRFSSGFFISGEASVIASLRCTIILRSTASLKRKALESSSSVSVLHSIFIST